VSDDYVGGLYLTHQDATAVANCGGMTYYATNNTETVQLVTFELIALD